MGVFKGKRPKLPPACSTLQSGGCLRMEGSRMDLLIDVCPFASVQLPATGYQTWWKFPFVVGGGVKHEIMALDKMAIVNYSLL